MKFPATSTVRGYANTVVAALKTIPGKVLAWATAHPKAAAGVLTSLAMNAYGLIDGNAAEANKQSVLNGLELALTILLGF